jgi:hypothetical protein
MKRYLLFCGSNYYPRGGIDDFHGDYDSVEEAETAFRQEVAEEYPKGDGDEWFWGHVYDIQERRKIDLIIK